jgi:septal ring factor EnvC (AmiA/AmiB activator)
MLAYLPLCLSALSFLAVLLLAVRREVREDGMTPAQRLKKAEAQLANHDQLHTGQTQARERLAETLTAEIKRVETDADRRCTALEQTANKVGKMQLDMATMQEQLKRLPDMERKLDHLTTLLTEFLARK